MSSPPVTAIVPSIRRNMSAEAASQTTTGDLCVQLGLIFSNAGVNASRSKISRLVRAYEHRAAPMGFGLIDFVGNQIQMTEHQRRVVADELRKVVPYADPTGESAVRNVVKTRGY